MGSIYTTWAEKEGEEITKTAGKTGVLGPWRMNASPTHKVAERYIKTIIMVNSSEWHGASGNGKTGVS